MNRRYETGAEFKARQALLPFADSFLVALEIAASVKAGIEGWFKRTWRKAKPAIFAPWTQAPLAGLIYREGSTMAAS